MAFTDHLFVLATSVGDSEQEVDGLGLVLLFALSVTQDVQEGENASVLQELHQVLITDPNRTDTENLSSLRERLTDTVVDRL